MRLEAQGKNRIRVMATAISLDAQKMAVQLAKAPANATIFWQPKMAQA